MANRLHTNLLNQIVSNYSRRSEAVNALSEILRITPDAIYRRLRGESLLNAEEVERLAVHYGVSLDALMETNSRHVTFDFLPGNGDQQIISVEHFMQSIHAVLLDMKHCTQVKFYSISANMHLFYYLLAPRLFKFKLFVWGNTIWNIPGLRMEKYSEQIFPAFIDGLIQRIRKDFLAYHTVELWSMSMVDDTLNQLAYFTYSGRFESPDIVQSLYDELTELIRLLQHFASHGHKYNWMEVPLGPFELYHNEVIHASQTFYASSIERELVIMPFATPSFVVTQNQQTCDHIKLWFDRIIRKSSPISTTNEKNRNFFFNQILQNINFSRQRLEHLLE